jgi:hypothetical protein
MKNGRIVIFARKKKKINGHSRGDRLILSYEPVTTRVA